MSEFELLKRTAIAPSELASLEYDVFLSAFNDSDRVKRVFEQVSADRKVWFVHAEYGYESTALDPGAERFVSTVGMSEVEFWRSLFDQVGIDELFGSARVGIDITGVVRPHLMILPKLLRQYTRGRIDLLYSDPHAYVSGSATVFSKGPVTRVAPIGGLEGLHSSADTARDLLIIGAGYDSELVRRVADHKKSATHRLLVGLPGLQAHMYQESRLRLAEVNEFIRALSDRTYMYAPADNPFITASTIQDCVESESTQPGELNIYLSALGPKPQVLGFALYSSLLGPDMPVSALFPYSESYSRETSRGLARTHVYELEMDWFAS